ncbi:MAG TPA: hypothetical protein PLV04_07315 [Phenylobacterium sp.]|nr:hypothetical protein [Phenylobacterium sp.]
MSNAVNVVVVGAGGRMGRMLIESTLKDGEAKLVAATETTTAEDIAAFAKALQGRTL